jgi:hypothetical protein
VALNFSPWLLGPVVFGLEQHPWQKLVLKEGCVPHGRQGAERERQEGARCQYPFQEHTPNDLTSSDQVPVLKLLQHPDSATGSRPILQCISLWKTFKI